MIGLEELQPNTVVRGILPDCLVSVVAVQWFGSEALELTYKDPAGRGGKRTSGSSGVGWATPTGSLRRCPPSRLWKFRLSEVDAWVRPGGADDETSPPKRAATSRSRRKGR